AVEIRDSVFGSVDGSRVREVEDTSLVPLARHVETARRARGLHVLLERVEVAHRRRMEQRRPQLDVLEGVLRVSASGASTREIGLQRLRGELVDNAVLDQTRPPTLEVMALRGEHAEPQRLRLRVDDHVCDVGTRATDELLDL